MAVCKVDDHREFPLLYAIMYDTAFNLYYRYSLDDYHMIYMHVYIFISSNTLIYQKPTIGNLPTLFQLHKIHDTAMIVAIQYIHLIIAWR